MSAISYYYRSKQASSILERTALGFAKKWVCDIKCDVLFDYQVTRHNLGQNFDVTRADEKIATANNCTVALYGQAVGVMQKVSGGWLLSNGKILKRTSIGCYSLDGMDIVKIKWGGHLLDSIFHLITKGVWQKPAPYIRVEYNESMIEQIVALLLLLAEPEADAST